MSTLRTDTLETYDGTFSVPVNTILTSGSVHSAPEKTTPADADELGYSDSATGFSLVRTTWANLKTWLSGLFVSKTGDSLTGALNWAPAVSIASAATTQIGSAASNLVTITGATTITSFGSAAAGVVRTVTFAGALTLTHTSNGIILPGSVNITTAAYDAAVFQSFGGGIWVCISYKQNSALPVLLAGNQTVAGAKTFSSLTRIVANTTEGVTYSSGQLTLESSNLTPASLGFHRSGATACQLRHDGNGLILSGTSQIAAADFYAYGNVTAYSDIRLKRNVEPITGALEKVLRIGGYTFEKINDENENVGRRHTGVIAQEILAVIPEAVSERDGYYAVSYGNLVGLLIEAIKEQNAQINELKAQVNNLKAGS